MPPLPSSLPGLIGCRLSARPEKALGPDLGQCLSLTSWIIDGTFLGRFRPPPGSFPFVPGGSPLSSKSCLAEPVSPCPISKGAHRRNPPALRRWLVEGAS